MDSKKKDIELHKSLSEKYVNKRYNQKYSMYYQNYWNDELIALLSRDSKSNILDFGCGTGILLKQLNKSHKSCFGIDISQEMLKFASELCGNCNLIKGDGDQLPFYSESLNAVISRGAIHHVPMPQNALNEINRSLMSGGILVLSEPCIDSIGIRLIRAILYKNRNRFTEVHRAFKSNDLKIMLRESGFKEIKEMHFGYIAYPLCGFPDIISLLNYVPLSQHVTKLLILLDKLLSHMPIIKNESWQIIIVAKK